MEIYELPDKELKTIDLKNMNRKLTNLVHEQNKNISKEIWSCKKRTKYKFRSWKIQLLSLKSHYKISTEDSIKQKKESANLKRGHFYYRVQGAKRKKE